MPNEFAVQFQRNIVDEPLPPNKSQALPAHTPMVGGYMPGETPKPAKGQMRNLLWKSWLKPHKSSKKAKRRSNLHSLMGK